MPIVKIVPMPGPQGPNGNGQGGNADTGDITFDGVKIIGAGTASGDGYNNGTIELVPDVDLYVNDQYLIIDPTNPNHIHIRAGGTQDESNADLILGGERNHVYIEDDARQVSISTRPAATVNNYTNGNESNGTEMLVPDSANITLGLTTVNVGGTDYAVTSFAPDPLNGGFSIVTATGASFVSGETYSFSSEQYYNNYWQFNSNGYMYGPAMGGLFVSGILNGEDDLYVQASGNEKGVVISGNGGEFLGDSSTQANQIATIGDLPTGATGSFVSNDNKTITVTNGIITAIEAIV